MELRPISNSRSIRFAPGDRAGVFTVLSVLGTKHFRRGVAVVFQCRCDCGRICQRDRQTLIKGLPRDCGPSCRLRLGTSPEGSSRHPLHKRWWGMLERCLNPKCKSFRDYGARSVQVCQRWRHGEGGKTGFECFVEDMGEARGMTLERKDSTGHYEPSNCTWASKGDQSRNRRNVPLFDYCGEKLTKGQLAERTGIPYFTLHARLKAGWSLKKALETPIRPLSSK